VLRTQTKLMSVASSTASGDVGGVNNLRVLESSVKIARPHLRFP